MFIRKDVPRLWAENRAGCAFESNQTMSFSSYSNLLPTLSTRAVACFLYANDSMEGYVAGVAPTKNSENDKHSDEHQRRKAPTS